LRLLVRNTGLPMGNDLRSVAPARVDASRHSFDNSRHGANGTTRSGASLSAMAKRARSPLSGFTVSAELVRGLVDCAARCGVSPASLADAQGANARAPRYSGEVVLKLWERIRALSGDPIIAFRMALVAEARTFGVLGQILPRCANVLDALRQTARFAALASQGAHIAVARSATTLAVTVAVDAEDRPIHASIILWALTNLSLTPERLTGQNLRPLRVECALPSPGPKALRVLRDHLPFRFAAGANRVVFARAVGDASIPSADADLAALLAEVMEQHLARLGPASSFEHGLATILRQMINGTMPTLASLSARAGLSRRSLQRRLAAAGTSFQALFREVMQGAAADLLARGDLSQGEIAFMLGYSEVSAFSRAYRGWTGHPPGGGRAEMARDGGN
jgi:AraC-like DNA-binding protein